MIGLDTNVIVRYITQDDAEQSAVATRIFEELITDDNHGFISSVALCETVWVLARAYKQPREKLIEVIKQLLLVDCIEVEHRDEVWSAVADFEEGTADFSDYLIGRIGREAGVKTTYSFDDKAVKNKLLFTKAR